LKNTYPAKLVGAKNPCDIVPSATANPVQDRSRTELRFAWATVWIVAQCGDHDVKLQLSDRRGVDFDQLRTRTLGGPIDSPSPEQNLSLQQAGAAIVPELLAGRFDAGFSGGAIAKVLADYHGPVPPPDFTAELVDASDYPFASYAPPVYPAAAKIARAFGNVLLELTIDQTSGEVRQAVGLSGDPLLSSAALEAARKWRFVPGAISAQPIHVMLDFSWRCP
jgi:TonB family protein